MTNKRKQVEQKLSFLYEKLEELEVVPLKDKQTNSLNEYEQPEKDRTKTAVSLSTL